jgi:plasmid stabilization system protein ParE
MRIRFLPEAEAELLEAARWYREQAPGLDHEFMRCVDDALATVGRMPRIFPVVHRQLRRALVRRFPYAVYFEMKNEVILVYAVFHFSRSPRRWRKRSGG